MRKMLLSACVALAVWGCGGDDGDLPECLALRCISAYSACGDRAYDSSTEFCSYSDGTYMVYPRCGGKDFSDPSTKFCFDSTVYLKCGGKDYNPSTQYCSNGTVKTYYGFLTDSRDGKAYKITAIGYQTWFAQNLNYNALGSKCYDDSDSNCDKYGRLYDWATAMGLNASYNDSSWYGSDVNHRGICPEGWYVPNGEDWVFLMDYAGGSSVAGTKLKAASGWSSDNRNGTDDYGFSALPSNGNYYSDGSWWSASEREQWDDYAYYWYIGSYSDGGSYSGFDDRKKSELRSVRCVQGQGNYEKHIGKGNNISNYRTVVIGTQTWMAENLDYVVEGSKCYKDNPARCNAYGSLYDWATAMALPSSCNSNSCSSQIQSPHRGICPSGWHIPSDAEWDVLITAAGGITKLKAASGWNGTDDYGFSALPGGIGSSDGSFNDVGRYGNWWSANEDDHYSNSAYSRDMYYNYDHAYWIYYKSRLFSVRCVQD